jgi:transposase
MDFNTIHERAAGIDVHKKIIVVTIMTGSNKNFKQETLSFGTTTEELRMCGNWLKTNKISVVGMESTGIYWIPPFNVLKEEFNINVKLAHAGRIKNMPGRKTDVKDSEWICKLLRNGLLEESFIPPREIVHLRKLSRMRKKNSYNLSSAKNRVIKQLETMNIKLGNVLSSVFTVSGWKVIRAIASGEKDPKKLATLFDKQVKASKEDIIKAVTGIITDEDITLLQFAIKCVDQLQQLVDDIEGEVTKYATNRYSKQIELLTTIPGVSTIIAITMIAEMGINMDQFLSDAHFASWVGLVPGNNESAGKKKSTTILKGNTYFKTALVPGAWNAIKQKGTYWSTFFVRKKSHIGPKKAIIAVAHKMATSAYRILKDMVPYHELGGGYLDAKAKENQINYYKKKLAELGIHIPIAVEQMTVA